MTTYSANNPTVSAPIAVLTVADKADVVAAAATQSAGTLIYAVTQKNLYICLPDFAASPAANTMTAYEVALGMTPA